MRLERRWIGTAVCLGLLIIPSTLRAYMLEVIPQRTEWRYRDTPAALPADWKDLGFDDSTWPTGVGYLGYGEPWIDTVIPYGPNASDKYRTTYFRRTFEMSVDWTDVVHLLLRVKYDDGFVMYLNGTEILRRAMPVGPIDYETFASSHEATQYELVNLVTYRDLLVQGTNVLAVELHQSSASSSDLVFDMGLTYGTDPELVLRGPYLQSATPNSVVVRWRTSLPTRSTVTYGKVDGQAEFTVTLNDSTRQHEVTLDGLEPLTRYYYRIGTPYYEQAGDSSYHFRTPPPPGITTTTRLWVIGDSGLPGNGQLGVRDAYAEYRDQQTTDVWLMLGDNAYQTGTDNEYQQGLFDAYPRMLRSAFLWPTRGNHDQLHGGADNDYYEIFTLPTDGSGGGLASGSEAYYSFDYGNVHFVCLDSEGSGRSIGSPMLQWLRADLALTTQKWIVAFWHHPPYSKGSHDSDDAGDSGGRMRDMRQNVVPILDSAGVDLSLSGHSHSYERSFLVNGHYGTSNTLNDGMRVDDGDGRETGDGAYVKPTYGKGPFEGTVHLVAGNAAQASGGSLDHPIMVETLDVLGSLAVDITANRLDARMIDQLGAALDSFTIIKGAPVDVPLAGRPGALRLDPVSPNPSRSSSTIDFTLGRDGRATLSVYDVAGRRLVSVLDRPLSAGRHRAVWNGSDPSGRALAAGVYYLVLEQGGERRARQIVRLD